MMPKMRKKVWMVAKSVADLLMCSLQRETENVSYKNSSIKKLTNRIIKLQDPWEQEIREVDQVDDEADREVGIVADAVAADLTREKLGGKEDELARVQNHRAEKHEDVRVQTRVGEKSQEKKGDLDRDPEVSYLLTYKN